MRVPFLTQGRDYAIVPMEQEDCIAAERLHREDFGRPWSTEEFADLRAQETVFGFVARPVGRDRRWTSGFVLARLAAGEGEILTIAVARTQRRAGLGRGLMDAVLRHLHSERAQALFLEVDETNAPALALYRRLGFFEVARRPGYYQDPAKGRTDALVMRRGFAPKRRMIFWLRLAWTVFAAILITLPLAAFQLVAFHTKWFDITLAPRLWYALAAKILHFRMTVHGAPVTGRPLLIAANHISWTDIVVFGALIRGAFIAKAEVAGWPVIGPLSRLQGTVLVDRARKREAGRQVDDLTASLLAGRAMILFAEGTTSDGTIMLPFKTSLFAAAKTAIDKSSIDTVHVQPVAIAYTRMGGLAMDRRLRGQVSWTGDEDLWSHLRRFLAFPSIDVEVRFGEPLLVQAQSDRKRVAQAAEAEVRAMFGRSLAGRG